MFHLSGFFRWEVCCKTANLLLQKPWGEKCRNQLRTIWTNLCMTLPLITSQHILNIRSLHFALFLPLLIILLTSCWYSGSKANRVPSLKIAFVVWLSCVLVFEWYLKIRVNIYSFLQKRNKPLILYIHVQLWWENAVRIDFQFQSLVNCEHLPK